MKSRKRISGGKCRGGKRRTRRGGKRNTRISGGYENLKDGGLHITDDEYETLQESIGLLYNLNKISFVKKILNFNYPLDNNISDYFERHNGSILARAKPGYKLKKEFRINHHPVRSFIIEYLDNIATNGGIIVPYMTDKVFESMKHSTNNPQSAQGILYNTPQDFKEYKYDLDGTQYKPAYAREHNFRDMQNLERFIDKGKKNNYVLNLDVFSSYETAFNVIIRICAFIHAFL
jgi:hypothetical protein